MTRIVTIDGHAVEADDLHRLCKRAADLYPGKHNQRQWVRKTLQLRGIKPRVCISLAAREAPVHRTLREAGIHPADVLAFPTLPRRLRMALKLESV